MVLDIRNRCLLRIGIKPVYSNCGVLIKEPWFTEKTISKSSWWKIPYEGNLKLANNSDFFWKKFEVDNRLAAEH